MGLKFFTIFLVFLVPIVKVTEARADADWTHFGVRPLAMGNAYVAIADDYNALFYNPAGIARLKEWNGEFFNPAIAFSKNTVEAFSDIVSLVSGDANNYTAVLKLAEKNSGTNHYAGLKFTPHLVLPNFGIGLGVDNSLFGLQFSRYPSAKIDVGIRGILPITYARNFLEKRLSIGASLKFRFKGGIDREFSIEDLAAFQSDSNTGSSDGPALSDYVSGGYGVGADIGLLFTPIEPMEPTLGLSVTDIGGSSYEKANISGKALGTPERQLPSVNIGLSCKPYETGTSFLRASIDMHSINQPYSFTKKLHTGLEYSMGRIFKVQTGLHQGYLSGGMQIELPILLSVRLATYGEEIGSSAGTIEDRRYVLQFKLLI